MGSREDWWVFGCSSSFSGVVIGFNAYNRGARTANPADMGLAGPPKARPMLRVQRVLILQLHRMQSFRLIL